ncbi:hypothetical protein DFH09DRAFT_938153 [Mycena vulgaris]|nr:hypothetical protein DFH09DRAFT_938153 [Mycena vulgaris]
MGMPVMLRSNDATEMCITKGQEGAVVGWDESIGPIGQRILDTLFVKLINPPRDIQVEGLPINVVPLVRTVSHITVLLEDDTLLSVLREQIVALINFGMTDYTSQGKSRPWNVVELANCRTHMSYYVALSRGFTAEGTVIVQGLNVAKITSGISGYLRQELRELEILDEITRLRCEGLLPRSVTGLYRRRLIRSFYAWKSNHRDPAHFHPAMCWDSSMGPRVPEPVTYSEWKPSIPKNNKRKNAAVRTDADEDQKKAKRSRSDLKSDAPTSGSSTVARSLANTVPGPRPVGLIWDNRDHSCAYDATFTILNNLWAEDNLAWTHRFSDLSPLMEKYALNLNSMVQRAGSSLEQVRDGLRSQMHSINPGHFPYGPNSTSIDKLAGVLLPSKSYGSGKQSCLTCGFADPLEYSLFEASVSAGLSGRRDYPVPVPLQDWIRDNLALGRGVCPACRLNNVRSKMFMIPKLTDVPGIMLIDINHDRLSFSDQLGFDSAGVMVKLNLRGIIYGGQNHFTCRFIDSNGTVWFHDGISTGRTCIRDASLEGRYDPMALHKCGEKLAVAVIYARG